MKRRQRGFLLNPARFAGTTQSGAISVLAESTPTMAGAAIGATSISSIAEADIVWDSGTANSGAMSMIAESVATMAGAGRADSSVSVAGEGNSTFAAEATPLPCDAADFDGTDHMERGADLSGIADSKSGIFSAWVRLDGGNTTNMYLLMAATTVNGGAAGGIRMLRFSNNTFAITGSNAAASTILDLVTVGTYLAGATWLHVLASWNLATAGAHHLYINNVSDLNAATFTDDTLNYTNADWGIGGTPAATTRLNGCLSELYFAPGQYLDFSVEANRRKFISSSGKPVFLGTTGSLPTTVEPIIYLHLEDGESAANFAINRGTGGNFTITGTLDTASSSPSD